MSHRFTHEFCKALPRPPNFRCQKLPSEPRAVRPADAATLVLLRPAGGELEVLLGRRHRKSRFMPGIYVYPGGRVGRKDHLQSGCSEDIPPPPAHADQATRRRWPAFVRAALRETFEETGLMLGRPLPRGTAADPVNGIRAPWNSFSDAGVAPAFEAARLIVRAITPPASPIRFHNRFFLADGRHALGPIRGDGELEDIGWVPVPEALRLPMAGIGTHVLSEALAQWRSPKPGHSALFRWVGSEMRPRFSTSP